MLAADVGLALVFAVGLALTAYMISNSWGGTYWQFDGGLSLLVCLLALARRRRRVWTAVTGLTVAAAATVIAEIAGLPHEPSPTMALALSVLVGSAVRRLPAPWAGAIAAGGLAVIIGSWLSGGSTPVPVFNGAAWFAALAIGLSLRLLDTRGRPVARYF